MHINLAAILLFLTVLSGLILLLDNFLLAPKRKLAEARSGASDAETDASAGSGGEERQDIASIIVEYARSIFPVVLIVLILRSFIFEPFRIPSGSMKPTLVEGDFIVVNKFSYGIRLPVINTKVFDIGSPERGDVFVFRYPLDPKIDFIKRVVGIPGDRILYKNKKLYINGELIGDSYQGEFADPYWQASVYQEDLLGIDHQILKKPGAFNLAGPRSWVVPQGHYFAMGDNRDNSRDSRYWGFVPEENLIGKAKFIWMSWHFGGGQSPKFSRIGTAIE